MSDGRFTLGTHPSTGQPWAYCLACSSGNGPTIAALRAACDRNCGVTLYDADGMPYRGQPLVEDEEVWQDT